MNAYMNFVKECFADVKAERPNASFGEIGKILGEMWRSMTDAEKQEYSC